MEQATRPTSVCIFAPAPLLTITVERDPDEVHIHAGGQGVWVARMVAALGLQPVLCTALGGETGDVVRHLIDPGVVLHATAAAAPTGAYLHDRSAGERRELWRSRLGRLGRHEQDALQDEVLGCAGRAAVCVLTGVPPGEDVVEPDMYRRVAADMTATGVPVVADVSGPLLPPVLEARPRILKVSADELVRDGYAADTGIAAMTDALEALHDQGAEQVVISLGREGALAVAGDVVMHVQAPELVAVEPRGAGDSMTAALAVGVARGLEATTTLRLAVAAGALNATHHGLGTGSRDAIETLVGRVTVEARHEVGRR